MKLSLVVNALKDHAPSFNGRVAGAAEFQGLDANTKMTLPAAYVIPTGDNAAEQQSQTDYYQVISEGFAVIAVLDNRQDPRGQTASFDAVDRIRSEIFRAILGWEPDETNHLITYDGGQVIEMTRAALFYQFDFKSDRELISEDTRHGFNLEQLEELETVTIDIDFADPGNGPDDIIEHHIEFHHLNK